MSTFKQYLNECYGIGIGGEDGATLPAIEGVSDAVDLTVVESRNPVNDILADITETTDMPPEVIYERVRGILSEVGYQIPSAIEKTTLFSELDGEDFIALVHPSLPTRLDGSGHCFLYFAFYQNDDQTYDTWAEVVTEEELDDILTEDLT